MYTMWKARTQAVSLWTCPEKHIHIKIGTVTLELTRREFRALATLNKTVHMALCESPKARLTVTGR